MIWTRVGAAFSCSSSSIVTVDESALRSKWRVYKSRCLSQPARSSSRSSNSARASATRSVSAESAAGGSCSAQSSSAAAGASRSNSACSCSLRLLIVSRRSLIR
eukprot:3735213-Prymnesium_polylepis.1